MRQRPRRDWMLTLDLAGSRRRIWTVTVRNWGGLFQIFATVDALCGPARQKGPPRRKPKKGKKGPLGRKSSARFGARLAG